MATFTYDPGQVIVSFRGHEVTGYADGTFVSVERDEDAYSKTTGADGCTIRSRSRNSAGNVTITLLQVSPSNDALSEAALADEAANAGAGPLLIKDLNGTTLISAPDAWVRKMPSVTLGKEPENREWTLDTGPMAMFVGGNAPTSSPQEA